MSLPTISGRRIWQNHERRVLNIFKRALELLRDEDNLDVNENELNRRLYFCISKANNEFAKQEEGIVWPIISEANNQPDADDEQNAKRENKRPDFQWGLTDRTEEDPVRQNKFFVIECKRLGVPVRKDRVFNKDYVEKGIFRFVRPEHGYGKSTSSGAMIGYIRSMASDDILNEVNKHVGDNSLSLISLASSKWIKQGVSRLEQKLDRPDVPPTPFQLHHLWVDFR